MNVYALFSAFVAFISYKLPINELLLRQINNFDFYNLS